MEPNFTLSEITHRLTTPGYLQEQTIHYLELMNNEGMTLEEVIERLRGEQELLNQSQPIPGT